MEITVHELRELLDGAAAPRLLDVRQPHEFEFVKLDGALPVTTELVDTMMAEWPKDTPIVTYCHHGVRSLQAARFLAQQGFTDVRSLAGGIDAWAVEIEPGLPRY